MKDDYGLKSEYQLDANIIKEVLNVLRNPETENQRLKATDVNIKTITSLTRQIYFSRENGGVVAAMLADEGISLVPLYNDDEILMMYCLQTDAWLLNYFNKEGGFTSKDFDRTMRYAKLAGWIAMKIPFFHPAVRLVTDILRKLGFIKLYH